MKEKTEKTEETVETNGLSSEMPEPVVMDYEIAYTITEKFKEDLIISISELPYVVCEGLIKFVEDNKTHVELGVLNEYIRKIAQLPYRYVNGLMANIQNPQTQPIYFTPIKK